MCCTPKTTSKDPRSAKLMLAQFVSDKPTSSLTATRTTSIWLGSKKRRTFCWRRATTTSLQLTGGSPPSSITPPLRETRNQWVSFLWQLFAYHLLKLIQKGCRLLWALYFSSFYRLLNFSSYYYLNMYLKMYNLSIWRTTAISV